MRVGALQTSVLSALWCGSAASGCGSKISGCGAMVFRRGSMGFSSGSMVFKRGSWAFSSGSMAFGCGSGGFSSGSMIVWCGLSVPGCGLALSGCVPCVWTTVDICGIRCGNVPFIPPFPLQPKNLLAGPPILHTCSYTSRGNKELCARVSPQIPQNRWIACPGAPPPWG